MPRSDHDHPVDPERVAAAQHGLIDVADAGRLAGLLGVIQDPVRSRVLLPTTSPPPSPTSRTAKSSRATRSERQGQGAGHAR